MPAKITFGSEALWTLAALNGAFMRFLMFGYVFPGVAND
jgi:hypothetical protein